MLRLYTVQIKHATMFINQQRKENTKQLGLKNQPYQERDRVQLPHESNYHEVTTIRSLQVFTLLLISWFAKFALLKTSTLPKMSIISDRPPPWKRTQRQDDLGPLWHLKGTNRPKIIFRK